VTRQNKLGMRNRPPKDRLEQGGPQFSEIKFPDNITEMLDAWASCPEENVGWCLLCNGPIFSEKDMIPETNTHGCPEGIRSNRSHRKATMNQSVEG
jgi:hypothetical protein